MLPQNCSPDTNDVEFSIMRLIRPIIKIPLDQTDSFPSRFIWTTPQKSSTTEQTASFMVPTLIAGIQQDTIGSKMIFFAFWNQWCKFYRGKTKSSYAKYSDGFQRINGFNDFFERDVPLASESISTAAE